LIKLINCFLIISAAFLIFSCGEDEEAVQIVSSEYKDVSMLPEVDKNIQRSNLNIRKNLSPHNDPCDPLSISEYIINNFPSGTYLLYNDGIHNYNIPDPAVLYSGEGYIFAVVAESRGGERLIEPQNIIGYDQSFIDYDSTALGTAFIYLVLFECRNDNLNLIWKTPVYSHGGLKKINPERWDYTGTDIIRVEFYNAPGRGTVNFNYFLINGIKEIPHLLMTYDNIDSRRTLSNINNDKYPDYNEHIFYVTDSTITKGGQVGFVWSPANKVYISTGNRKQTRPY
jgi:hypothetical protein